MSSNLTSSLNCQNAKSNFLKKVSSLSYLCSGDGGVKQILIYRLCVWKYNENSSNVKSIYHISHLLVLH